MVLLRLFLRPRRAWCFALGMVAAPLPGLAEPSRSSSVAVAQPVAVRAVPKLAGSWTVLSSASVVGYRARETLAGVKVPHDVVGRTRVVKGSLRIAGSAIAATSISVDMRTLKSDKPDRDYDLNTTRGPKWNNHPRGSFVLKRQIPVRRLRIGEVRRLTATGAVRLRGITRLVDFPLKARWNGETFQVTGQLPEKMTNFGFDPPSTAGVATVANDFKIEIKITFVRAKR